MSKTNYIRTKKELDFKLFTDVLKSNIVDLQVEQRGENLLFFWIHEKSTRGVDFSLEENHWYEIRNTVLSSPEDYYLTNQLAKYACELVEGELLSANENFDEEVDEASEEYTLMHWPLFDESKSEKQFEEDCSFLSGFVNSQNDTISIYGPIRKVHFGPHFFGKLKNQSNAQIAEKIRHTILKVNYEFTDFTYGNVITTSEKKDSMCFKLLTNTQNCIIDQYDYLLFPTGNEDYIAITNETLNTILPSQWQLLDECTVIAPPIPDKDFIDLVMRARELNQFNEMHQRMEAND